MPAKASQDFIMETFKGINLRTLVRKAPVIIVSKSANYPGKYVARLCDISNKETQYIVLTDTQEQIRSCISDNMKQIPYESKDGTGIIEAYIY